MTLSEDVRRACADGPLTVAEVAEATGMDPRTARHTLSRQCYCRFMAKTHDVPARYVVVKDPAPAYLRRAYEVMKRAERRGLVERRHASAKIVEWKLTERGMEAMEMMEGMEMEGCE